MNILQTIKKAITALVLDRKIKRLIKTYYRNFSDGPHMNIIKEHAQETRNELGDATYYRYLLALNKSNQHPDFVELANDIFKSDISGGYQRKIFSVKELKELIGFPEPFILPYWAEIPMDIKPIDYKRKHLKRPIQPELMKDEPVVINTGMECTQFYKAKKGIEMAKPSDGEQILMPKNPPFFDGPILHRTDDEPRQWAVPPAVDCMELMESMAPFNNHHRIEDARLEKRVTLRWSPITIQDLVQAEQRWIKGMVLPELLPMALTSLGNYLSPLKP